MDEVFDLTSCSSCFVPKSMLLHNPEAQYSLVPKLIHHKWQKHKKMRCSLMRRNKRTLVSLKVHDQYCKLLFRQGNRGYVYVLGCKNVFKPKGRLFLLLESFDIRKNMFWCWLEDGGRSLPTRFLTTAERST